MRYLVAETDLCDAYLIQPYPYPTENGAAAGPEFSAAELNAAIGSEVTFAETLTLTLPNKPLTELNYQEKEPYGILIRVLSGKVRCIALDMRADVSTGGQNESHILSSAWGQQLWLPPGFAHGVCALGDTAEIRCAVSTHYKPRKQKSLPVPS